MSRPWALLLLAACGPASIDLDGKDTGDLEDTAGTDSEETGGDTGGETGAVRPSDWVVDCEGGGDFRDIQPAIDAATSGETIGVRPCTYYETLDFLGKAIEVFGVDGSPTTILDAEERGTAVTMNTRESGWTRLAGFTVRGGASGTGPSGVEVDSSLAELSDVVFEDMGRAASVITVDDGFVDLVDVSIDGSGVTPGGSAVEADSGGLSILGGSYDCGRGQNAIYHHLSLNLTEAIVQCDGGYGVHNYHGEMVIARSWITGGTAAVYTYDTQHTPDEPDSPNERVWIEGSALGGGTYGLLAAYQTLTITNSVLWGHEAALSSTEGSTATVVRNSALVGAACGIASDTAMTLSASAFWDNGTDLCGIAGTPTVTSDPLFVAFPDDLALAPGSPLIDAGLPGAEWNDLDGTRNDIGVYGGPRPMGW